MCILKKCASLYIWTYIYIYIDIDIHLILSLLILSITCSSNAQGSHLAPMDKFSPSSAEGSELQNAIRERRTSVEVGFHQGIWP